MPFVTVHHTDDKRQGAFYFVFQFKNTQKAARFEKLFISLRRQSFIKWKTFENQNIKKFPKTDNFSYNKRQQHYTNNDNERNEFHHHQTRREHRTVQPRQNHERDNKGVRLGKRTGRPELHIAYNKPSRPQRRHHSRRHTEPSGRSADARRLLQGCKKLHAVPPAAYRRP